MAAKENELKHDPGLLCQALFDRAKTWLIVAMLCKVLAFAVGTLVIFFSVISKQAPFLVAGLTLASELFTWRSDRNKGTAESLRRKLDMRDSFGWPISKAEMSDLLIRIPKKLRKNLPVESDRENYFESKESAGPKRAVENIRESAWWSKHLSEKMWQICLVATIVLAALSVILLIASVETIRDFDTLSSMGRAVTSAILLIFSLGLLRLTISYYNFSNKAGQVEDQAERLLCPEPIDDVQAIKLCHEYQLARAAAPLIPTWVWKWQRNDLNELWADYRSNSQTGS
ncbi:MAG: hypothetical protein KIT57_09060 [Blastocatellales bacterium]|nr:hypothetical protein [Blastocatellales bacterium]